MIAVSFYRRCNGVHSGRLLWLSLVLLLAASQASWAAPATSHKIASVLFSDNFDAGLNPLWVNEGDCEWDTAGGHAHASIPYEDAGCNLIFKNDSWTDYVFEYDVRGNAGVEKAVLFRYSDPRSFYLFSIRSDWETGDEAFLHTPAENYAQLVQFPSENGVWYHVQISCQGNHIVIKVDGSTVIDFVDSYNQCPTGGIALNCYSGMAGVCDLSYDNVVVTEVAQCGDADGGGTINIGDAVYLIAYIFSHGPAPVPLSAGDSNCSGDINVADVVYLVDYIFSHGPAPCAECP
jgi:hypothetical protein